MNYKIRTPIEEVSELVQEEAFKRGFGWNFLDRRTQFTGKMGVILAGENITYVEREDEEIFNKYDAEEVSWQEFLFGEGTFYRWINSDSSIVYYLSKRDNKFHWIRDYHQRSCSHEYLNLSEVAYKCDQYGNKLRENTMQRKFTKSNLEIGMVVFHRGYMETPYLVQFNKDGEMFFKGLKTGFNMASLWREDLTFSGRSGIAEEVKWDIIKVMMNDSTLGLGGTVLYTRTEVEEMTLEEICDELGREVKVVK